MDKTTSDLMIQESKIRRLNESELSTRITRLEIALTATIRAIAFSQTMEAAWFDEPAERHLTRAAQVLGLDLADLGLAYAVTPACADTADRCPHGDDPALCNECRGIYDEP